MTKQDKEKVAPDIMDTEQRILYAAEREFMSKGFAGARTTSIAEAAGVTHAMLHYYFRTKQKLFDRILSEKIALLQDAVMSPLKDLSLPFEDMIRNIIWGHLDFIAANPDLPRFLIGEIYADPQKADAFRSAISRYAPIIVSVLQQKIDEAASEGRCRTYDAGMLMLDIVSLNIFSFMAAPLVGAALESLHPGSEDFVEIRKKENYDTIMRKLMPL